MPMQGFREWRGKAVTIQFTDGSWMHGTLLENDSQHRFFIISEPPNNAEVIIYTTSVRGIRLNPAVLNP